MVVEGGPFDIGGGPAVVVDDRDAVTGLQHSWDWTCSGRLVSTTTTRERLSMRSSASWEERKQSLYSGSCIRRSVSTLEGESPAPE